MLFLVIGCPLEGRNFGMVNRIAYNNDMSIKCMDGHLKAGSPSFIAKCNQNGTWEGDPRCIAIGDSQLIDMKGLLYMENTISVYGLPLQVVDVTFVYKIESLYNVCINITSLV